LSRRCSPASVLELTQNWDQFEDDSEDSLPRGKREEGEREIETDEEILLRKVKEKAIPVGTTLMRIVFFEWY